MQREFFKTYSEIFTNDVLHKILNKLKRDEDLVNGIALERMISNCEEKKHRTFVKRKGWRVSALVVCPDSMKH
jgi:hypothetical protein